MTAQVGEGKLLRFIGESDACHGKPLYQAIVRRLREDGTRGDGRLA